ncbi:hypothetical protein Q5752_005853 [Cryptotrichosporon argae]
MDALIAPGVVWPESKFTGFRTSVWSMIDRPVAALPVTAASKDKDKPYFSPKGPAYDPDPFEGCPVGVQLISRRLDEECLLAITRVSAEAVKSYSS